MQVARPVGALNAVTARTVRTNGAGCKQTPEAMVVGPLQVYIHGVGWDRSGGQKG